MKQFVNYLIDRSTYYSFSIGDDQAMEYGMSIMKKILKFWSVDWTNNFDYLKITRTVEKQKLKHLAQNGKKEGTAIRWIINLVYSMLYLSLTSEPNFTVF